MPTAGAELSHAHGRVDRQTHRQTDTDKHDEAFLNFANASKNCI
jgi:hypothetical protein